MSPTTRTPAEPPAADEPALAEARKTDATMWGILGHMVSAIVVYGGFGYLLGRWTGHPILLLFGVLFGVALSTWYTIHSVSRMADEKPRRK
ncbi:AtpZ/AtpI family protein [Actinocrinis puniceicyclus]|uniref:AtpZ/AtpI family protein n=1 Tax=Actinocrinis puniceicyclus TaxID=977794 RepID=A0A8J8BD48_9ACTN|nr:AtpZ/AtpI family protein [Actinocrinis puniceicyclus]MBS2964883.1 AtpZ/AtpI family protein [Actinocrinis puniceicyclus]